jgi:transcriptional regulator with XRE-family HTH domain
MILVDLKSPVKDFMSSLKNIFSKRLRDVRITRGLSQSDLASKVDLQRSSVSKMETLDYPNLPSIEALVALAAELRVSTDYLLGLSENSSISEEDHPPIPDWVKPLLTGFAGFDPVRIEVVTDIVQGADNHSKKVTK